MRQPLCPTSHPKAGGPLPHRVPVAVGGLMQNLGKSSRVSKCGSPRYEGAGAHAGGPETAPFPDRDDPARRLPDRAPRGQRVRARRAPGVQARDRSPRSHPLSHRVRARPDRTSARHPFGPGHPDRDRAARGRAARLAGCAHRVPARDRAPRPPLPHLPRLVDPPLPRRDAPRRRPVRDHGEGGADARGPAVPRPRRHDRRLPFRKRAARLRRALGSRAQPPGGAGGGPARARALGRARARGGGEPARVPARGGPGPRAMSESIGSRTAGSSDVGLAFLAELERFAATDRSSSPAALRGALLQYLRAVQALQPTLALVHQLAARALVVADAGLARGDSVAELRAQLARSCAAERADLEAGLQAVAATAVELLGQRGAWVATLSVSGAVRAALVEAARAGRAPRVLVGEGRPRLEGRLMAEALARAGIETWLVVDAALPLLVSQARAVW